MAPCYVVFEGRIPRIYMTWHECTLQVLGFSNASYMKYQNYDQAVHDYNASKGLACVSQKMQPSHSAALPIGATDGKQGSWKNMIILALCVMVFALWQRLKMSPSCNCMCRPMITT